MDKKVKQVRLVTTTYNSSAEPIIKTKYNYIFEYDNDDTIYIDLSNIEDNNDE